MSPAVDSRTARSCRRMQRENAYTRVNDTSSNDWAVEAEMMEILNNNGKYATRMTRSTDLQTINMTTSHSEDVESEVCVSMEPI